MPWSDSSFPHQEEQKGQTNKGEARNQAGKKGKDDDKVTGEAEQIVYQEGRQSKWRGTLAVQTAIGALKSLIICFTGERVTVREEEQILGNKQQQWETHCW